MDRELGKDIPAGEKRIEFLESNCDKVVEKGYMKQYSPEELLELKDNLADMTIEINDIEEKKKEMTAEFNDQLKPLKEDQKTLLANIKNKAEFVQENCYMIVDRENRMVGFYNSNGDLIESRGAFSNELQGTIFQMNRTCTNN